MFLYKKDTTDFLSHGEGKIEEIIDAVVEERLNGIYDLTFSIDSENTMQDKIKLDMLIKANTPKGEQIFRVNEIQKDLKEMTIYARHLFFDLENNFIVDTNIVDKSGVDALKQLLNRAYSTHNFNVVGDNSKKSSSRLVRLNLLEAFLSQRDNSIINRFKGEIERDNYTITYKNRIGEDRGVVIRYAKNLTGLDFKEDTRENYNAVLPKGFDGLLLPEIFVKSSNYQNETIKRHIMIDYSDIISKEKTKNVDNALEHTEAMNELRKRALNFLESHENNTNYRVLVNFVELSKFENYKEFEILERIFLGDNVKIVKDDLIIDSRVVAYKWDCINKEYINLTLNTNSKSFISGLTNLTKRLDTTSENLENITGSIEEKARQEATKLINAGFGGHVRVKKDEILIMDTDSEATAKNVWRWNLGGFAYSKNGKNGPFSTAITMDGNILGDFLKTGSITSNSLSSDIGINLDISSNTAITQTVESLNKARDEVGTVRSVLEQTKNEFKLEFTNIKSKNNLTHEELNKIKSYLSYSSSGVLELGKSGSPFILQLTNEQMQFLENGSIVAYINGQKMYIDSLEILSSIIIGSHIVEKSGNNTVIRRVE